LALLVVDPLRNQDVAGLNRFVSWLTTPICRKTSHFCIEIAKEAARQGDSEQP
jgi:hypothetical protein